MTSFVSRNKRRLIGYANRRGFVTCGWPGSGGAGSRRSAASEWRDRWRHGVRGGQREHAHAVPVVGHGRGGSAQGGRTGQVMQVVQVVAARCRKRLAPPPQIVRPLAGEGARTGQKQRRRRRRRRRHRHGRRRRRRRSAASARRQTVHVQRPAHRRSVLQLKFHLKSNKIKSN